MDIDKVLRQLAASLGLASLELDHNRACAFLVDDELHTELRYDERADVLCLYAEVGRARPLHEPELFQSLLDANGNAESTGAAHFAFAPDHQEIVLCRTLVGDDPSPRMLIDELAELLTASRQWRGRLMEQQLVLH